MPQTNIAVSAINKARNIGNSYSPVSINRIGNDPQSGTEGRKGIRSYSGVGVGDAG